MLSFFRDFIGILDLADSVEIQKTFGGFKTAKPRGP